MWAIWAISAAIIWGFTYAISERLLKTGFAPGFMMTTYATIAFPVYLIMTCQTSNLKDQLALLKDNPKWGLTMIGIVFLYTVANYLVFYAIQQKNATSASLIEIAYPLFTAMFAWLLFRDVQLNWGIVAGATLIFSGITLVTIYAK